ncbi:MAG: class I SAM-dependent methyltransferase [Nitrosopumilus sp.]
MFDSSKFDSEIIKQFDKTAENYSKDYIFSNGTDLDTMLKQAHLNPTTTVLDVATGAGHVAMKIAPFAKKVHAVDITPKMISLLQDDLESKNIKNVETHIMHVNNLQFVDDSFDVVTCRFATHHFANVRAFLSEVKRVLRPKGKLILTDIIAPSSKPMEEFVNEINRLRDHTHVRQFSESEWESILLEQNFAIVDRHNNPLRHDFESWLERAKTSKENRNRIVGMFRNSSEAQSQFQTDPQMKFFIEDSMIFTAQV